MNAFEFALTLWAGFLLGVSFFAVPIKFQAKSLTLPVAVEVGKVTFHWFNRVEWGVWTIVMLLGWLYSTNTFVWISLLIIALCKSSQSFYLQPAMDSHSQRIIQGIMTDDSTKAKRLHSVYIVVEVVKLLVVLLACFYA